MSHKIVEEDFRFRCTICRAVSRTRRIIEEIPCVGQAADTFTTVRKATPRYTYVGFEEPETAQVGDLWWIPGPHPTRCVFAETPDGHAWFDTATGYPVPASRTSAVAGYHPDVRTVYVRQRYSEAILASKALGVNVKDEIEKQMSAMLIKSCAEQGLLPVTPAHVRTPPTPVAGTGVWEFHAECRAIPVP